MKKTILRMTVVLAIMLLLTIISVFVLAFVMYKVRFDETRLKICIGAIYFFVNFIGGLIMGKLAERRRLPYGILVGTTYFILILIISLAMKSVVGEGGFPVGFAAALTIAGGGLGGSVS